MIPDLFINMFYSILYGMVNGLPVMEKVPWSYQDMAALYGLVGKADAWLPVLEIMQSIPFVFGALGTIMTLKIRKLI